jgi:hypothetical protein
VAASEIPRIAESGATIATTPAIRFPGAAPPDSDSWDCAGCVSVRCPQPQIETALLAAGDSWRFSAGAGVFFDAGACFAAQHERAGFPNVDAPAHSLVEKLVVEQFPVCDAQHAIQAAWSRHGASTRSTFKRSAKASRMERRRTQLRRPHLERNCNFHLRRSPWRDGSRFSRHCRRVRIRRVRDSVGNRSASLRFVNLPARNAMIVQPKRVQGLKVNPGTGKKFDLINVPGEGVFVACHVTKQGGSNDLTQVALYIDGVNVVAITYAAADNIGFDGVNNSGIQLVKGPVDCLSIQYNEPLYFGKECRIEINTSSDAGVVQVVASAVIGKKCSYPN